jgi:DNA-binding transcriptional ArsR family regulator
VASGTALIDTPDQLVAITHPTRLRILDELRAPGTAAGVARNLGEPRQLINHHVQALAKAGLLRSVGERRNGNFVEQLYESAAGTFILSSRITWGGSERARTLAEQLSLRHLVEFGERLQRDALTLLDRAAFEGDEIPSASVEATVRFADAASRSAFVDEYLRLTAELIEQHAASDGDAYTVGLAVHPSVRETTT